MGEVVDRLLALWTDTPDGDDEALAAFRGLYADPVNVNGAPLTAAGLLARARTLRAAIPDLKLQVIDEFEAPGRVVVVHRMTGHQVGPLPTPVGEVPGSGEATEALTIDVLVVADGLVTDVWVTDDSLARFARLGAIRLAG